MEFLKNTDSPTTGDTPRQKWHYEKSCNALGLEIFVIYIGKNADC